MTDNELLLAISDIMDKKLDARIRPLEHEIASLRQQMETEIKILKLQNENEIIPRLQNIEECYISTFNRYKNSVEGYETMQSDIQLLKEVSKEHSKKLQMIF